MEQSPSSEANLFSVSQEIPRISYNPKVHYRIQKCPPTVPLLNHLDPGPTPTSHFLKIQISYPFLLLSSYQRISPGPRLSMWPFRKRICFCREELLAPRPTPKLEDYPLSAVRDCFFDIFAATLHTGSRLLHPQPEDAPYRGDRDPLITTQTYIFKNYCKFIYPYTPSFSYKPEIFKEKCGYCEG